MRLNSAAALSSPRTTSSQQFTMDQVIAMNCVKRAVESLESKMDQIKGLFQERKKHMGTRAQLKDLEQAMKTVSSRLFSLT